MTGMMDYLNTMLAALKQRKLMRRNKIGPGQYSTPRMIPRQGDYTGQQLRDIRATHGVGRPPLPKFAPHENVASCAQRVQIFGSQRKAAASLGMNLSTFQRALKKEQQA